MRNEKAQAVSEHPSLTSSFDLAEIVSQGFRLMRFRLKRLRRTTSRQVMPLRDFSAELLRSPRQVGAICPSSRTLARAMAEGLNTADDRMVVELGAGTGNITQALLDQGVPADRLIVVEHSEILARRLQRRFPAASILQGDAAELPALLGAQAKAIGGVVSSLPLRSLEPVTADAIIVGVLEILGNSGRLVQFTYDLRKPSVPEHPGLRRITSRLIWANLPPARVDVFDYQASGAEHVATEAAY